MSFGRRVVASGWGTSRADNFDDVAGEPGVAPCAGRVWGWLGARSRRNQLGCGLEHAGCVAVGQIHIQGARAAANAPLPSSVVVFGRLQSFMTVN